MVQYSKYIDLIEYIKGEFMLSPIYKRYIAMGIEGEINLLYDLSDFGDKGKDWIKCGLFKLEIVFYINNSSFGISRSILFVSDSFLLQNREFLNLSNMTFMIIESTYNYRINREDELVVSMLFNSNVYFDCDIYIGKILKVYSSVNLKTIFNWTSHEDINRLEYLVLHNVHIYYLNTARNLKESDVNLRIRSFPKTLMENYGEDECKCAKDLVYVLELLSKIFKHYQMDWEIYVNMLTINDLIYCLNMLKFIGYEKGFDDLSINFDAGYYIGNILSSKYCDYIKDLNSLFKEIKINGIKFV